MSEQFTSRADNIPLGVTLMICATLMLAGADAAGKWAAADYHVAQLNFMRGLFAVLVLVILQWRDIRAGGMRTRRPLVHIGRALILICLSYSWFFALAYMELADATAIAMAAPLYVAALSVPLLKEHVGWRRWTAVGVGFVGMLLVIRPGSSAFDPVALLVAVVALGYALFMISNRALRNTELLAALTLYPQIGILAVSSVLAPFVWKSMTLDGFISMALTGIFVAVAHMLMTLAFRHAPPSLLATLDYITLIWATALGYVLFGDLPDSFVAAGAALITAAGVFVIYREMAAKKADA